VEHWDRLARFGVEYLGIGREWAVIAHDDTIERIAHPACGQACSASAAGSPGNAPAASSAPEGIARRTPSWQPWTGGRRTCAPTSCTP
jgi:hypothetical protein